LTYTVNPVTGRVIFNPDKLGSGYYTPKGDFVSTMRVPVQEQLRAMNRERARREIIGLVAIGIAKPSSANNLVDISLAFV
jgi:hypothetical protein